MKHLRRPASFIRCGAFSMSRSRRFSDVECMTAIIAFYVLGIFCFIPIFGFMALIACSVGHASSGETSWALVCSIIYALLWPFTLVLFLLRGGEAMSAAESQDSEGI